MTAGDQARVSVAVALPPSDAFRIFTEEIDQWWRRGPRFRVADRSPGALHVECRLGGLVFETHGDAQHEIGVVTAWDPPHRFAFTWRSITFTRGETTEVDVRFTARGNGTEVALEHRGWSAIPDDHPVRHGQVGSVFLASTGRWWADLMTSLREHVAETRPR